ncbi:DEAD/DEAH box helicase [Spongiibacter tropicus]|uniref:DEAD/DEAH box helicase n=1 Tax=Spongiibacter tropicus TaxID=454602 RepID=UPI00300A24C3
MKLRDWQRDCLSLARERYATGQRHFLCLATPGAGKTHLASTLATELLAKNQIDLVVCFAPSIIVADDFQAALATQSGERFDGRLGAKGLTLTYQAMLTQPESFWSLFQTQRVFAIFDEIHHCAGQGVDDANAWGVPLITRIQDYASFTLALTGTPWRSDQRPIALARYGTDQVECDYRYGLDRAITDGVCRLPQLTLIDNDDIYVSRDGHTEHFRSLKALVSSEACRYEEVLRADSLISYSLGLATRKLNKLRRSDPNAGGLIVASSVEHAHQVREILHQQFDINAAIATYQERDPLSTIRSFKYGDAPWIVSVGMISEGTNVPRLRVCCHLTRVKTELYFRQVLGRILRANGTTGEMAYFYMPAEPTLVEYAERLIEDIPGNQSVVRHTQSSSVSISAPETTSPQIDNGNFQSEIDLHIMEPSSELDHRPLPPSTLEATYDSCVHWSTRFRSQIMRLQGITHA